MPRPLAETALVETNPKERERSRIPWMRTVANYVFSVVRLMRIAEMYMDDGAMKR